MGLATALTFVAAGCTPTAVVPPDGDVLFRDDFDGARLTAGWVLEGGNDEQVSLEARTGFVRLEAQAPDLTSEDPDFVALVRSLDGDFVIETRMEFDPAADRQLAGLLIVGDDGRTATFGAISASFAQGIFRGLSAVGERAGGRDPLTAFEALEGETVYLRAERRGSAITYLYGTDGVTFLILATQEVNLSGAVQAGLGNVVRDNCESNCDAGSAADFDYIEISLPVSEGS